MSEVSGSVILKLPNQLLKEFDCNNSVVSWSLINKIYEIAELSFESDASQIGHSYKKKEGFYTEGVEIIDGYLLLEPFDPEWMYIIQTLVEKGNNIEIYGGIFGEYGSSFYLLAKSSERYIASMTQKMKVREL